MPLRLVVGLAVVLAVSGCSDSGSSAGNCPKPIHYSDATEKAVQKALEALPPNSVLHQVMADYEQERDDLRFCH